MSEGIITSNGVPEKQPTSLESGVKDKMPPGKGRYTIGGKGTHGCKGYPVVGGEGKVHGCHPTKGAAIRQQSAIYASQNQQKMADALLELAKMHDSLDKLEKSMDGSGDESHNCPCAGQSDCQCDDSINQNNNEDNVVGKAEGVSTGDMVSWSSSGGTARGKIVRVIRDGKYNVPGSDFIITGTPDDPAVAIRVYRNNEPTDTIVGHKMSTLRMVGKSMNKDLEEAMAILELLKKNIDNSNDKTEQKSMHQEDEDWAKRDYSPEQRRAMARRGQAMPDGSFPIGNRADLGNAIQSVGRAANYDAARRHIIGRARALGAIDMLPEDWNVSKSIDGLFKNMPSSAKRVHTTGNARISMKMFKDEQ